MRVGSLCPFCNSDLVVTTGDTELLMHQQCRKCSKRWAEAKVSPDAVADMRASSAETTDEPFPKWSPP